MCLLSLPASVNGSAWVEGISLPKALLGAGVVSVTAGAGHLASQFAVADALLTMPVWGTDGSAVVASLVPEQALGAYHLTSPSSSRRLSTASDVLTSAFTQYNTALATLPGFTDGYAGLLWYPVGSYAVSYISVWLNCFGLFVGGRVPELLKTTNSGVSASLQVRGHGARARGGGWGGAVRSSLCFGCRCQNRSVAAFGHGGGEVDARVVLLPPLRVPQATWTNAVNTQIVADVNYARSHGFDYNDWCVGEGAAACVCMLFWQELGGG